MNALAPYIAALHQQSLLEEAELDRFARRSRASSSDVAAWRRGLGGGARRRAAAPRPKVRTSERTVGRALAC
jgi:hypothetical protein